MHFKGSFLLLLGIGCVISTPPDEESSTIDDRKTCSLPIRTKHKVRGKLSLSRNCSQDEIESSAANLSEFFDQYWEWKLSEYPEGATWVGVHHFDDRLTNISFEAFNQRYDQVLEFLEEAELLEKCVRDPKGLQNLKLLKLELTDFKEGHSYNGYYLPIDNIWGLHSNLPKVFDRMPLNSLQDYQTAISRLEKIPTYIDQVISLMRAGMAVGLTQHHHALKGLNDSLSKFAVQNPTIFPLYKLFEKEFPPSMTQDEISRVQEKALNTIKNKVAPAFEILRVFLTSEYTTRKEIAASSLPDGEEFYKRFIRIHTSSDFSAKEIHEVGLCEVERINDQIEQIKSELGYPNNSLKEVNKLMKEDPKNYYSTKEGILKGYEDVIKLVDSRLPKIFNRTTSFDIRVKSDPSPFTAAAYYESPPFDGSEPGTFYVGTNNAKGNPKYGFVTLTMHEASPGHHLQISHSIEFSDLPKFRRAFIGTEQFLPSGFLFPTAYTEGWALYAETLGFDLGLYGDPLDRFGHYTAQLWRACRLVVDTGIHALGWTREEAIDFMAQNLAYDMNSIESEVDRYIAWPGQALAYKIGQLRILDLREKTESALGSDFDIKEFHELILNLGSSPLDILEEEVNRFIDRNSESS